MRQWTGERWLQDLSREWASESNYFISPDWMAQAPIAFVANGRINVSTKTVDTFNQGNPRLYAADVAFLSKHQQPITRIVLSCCRGQRAANGDICGQRGPSRLGD